MRNGRRTIEGGKPCSKIRMVNEVVIFCSLNARARICHFSSMVGIFIFATAQFAGFEFYSFRFHGSVTVKYAEKIIITLSLTFQYAKRTVVLLAVSLQRSWIVLRSHFLVVNEFSFVKRSFYCIHDSRRLSFAYFDFRH